MSIAHEQPAITPPDDATIADMRARRIATVPTPNVFRDDATERILTAAETIGWNRCELLAAIDMGEAPPFAAEGVTFCDALLRQAADELRRRERLRRRPDAPPWPAAWRDRRPEAAELKRLVPAAMVAEAVYGVRLRQQGRELVGCCPFPDHDDGSPSFHVNPEKDLWHCFGCGRGGDQFTLLVEAGAAPTFLDALTLLADLAGARR